MTDSKYLNIENKSISSNILMKMLAFVVINVFINFYILYLYDFNPTIVTFMFMLLIPLVIAPFILSKDIMNPFSMFFMTSQFLFIYNMIDVNANKTSFRYGFLNSDSFDQAFVYSIIVIIIWYIMAYLGFSYAGKFENSFLFKNFSFTLKKPKLIASVLLIISIASFIYSVQTKGGLEGMILASQNRREAFSGQAYMIQLVSLGTIASLILLVHNFKKTSFLIIMLTFFMMSLFGGRGAAFGGTIFPYLICYHYKIRRIKLLELAILGTLTLIFVIFFGHYRLYQNFNIQLDSFVDIISTAADSTQGGEILPAMVGSLNEGHIPFANGRTLINIFFAPIPRSIWPDKPLIDESGIVGRLLIGTDGWGLPPGTYGIAYFNFGIIGVIISAFIIGIVVRQAYDTLVGRNNGNDNNFSLVVYAILTKYLFNLFSTSSQIDIIWFIVIFLIIKYGDRISVKI